MTKKKFQNLLITVVAVLGLIGFVCIPIKLVVDANTGHYEFNYKKFKNDADFATSTLRPFLTKRISSLFFEVYIDSVCKAYQTLSSEFFRGFESSSVQDRNTYPYNVTIVGFTISQEQWQLLSTVNMGTYKYSTDVDEKISSILGKSLWDNKFKLYSNEGYILEKPNSYTVSKVLDTVIDIGLSAFIVLLVIMFFATINSQAKKKEKQDTELKSAQQNVQNHPNEILPVWDLAQKTLDQYYTRNLEQIRWIFWLSLAVMVAGFALICYGIEKAINANENNKLIPIVASASGIITEFIGLTFIFIYNSTIKQAFKYTNSLEKMNTVGMSMKILDTLKVDETDTKKLVDAKIEIAKLLIQQTNKTSGSKQDEVK